MKIKILALILVATVLSSCSYKFSGASTTGLKNVAIRLFENNAPLVVPTLSNQLTEALKNRIRTQTKLILVTGESDASFEGRITGYDINRWHFKIALHQPRAPTDLPLPFR